MPNITYSAYFKENNCFLWQGPIAIKMAKMAIDRGMEVSGTIFLFLRKVYMH